MDEKTMVNDVLDGVKASLTTYQGVISVAQNKGYYKPAQPATITEIQPVKTELLN